MPWRGRDAERDEYGLDWPTLGIEAWRWIEDNCVIPDGDHWGEPFRLTDEMVRFLVHYYRVNPTGRSLKWEGPRFHYERGGQLVRPQKWGKGPFSAAIICFEAVGPALPDGWDSEGRIVGRPWPSPHIQITAISEDQPLALDTPVPTPTGWSTIGDLSPGDVVFGADGAQAVVERLTPVLLGEPCYLVSFSDGERIVASADHTWTIERKTLHGDRHETVTVTTRELAETHRTRAGSSRYRLGLCGPWQTPSVDLPVDPYILGLWLGNGATDDSAIAFNGLVQGELETILKPLLGEHEEIVWKTTNRTGGPTYRIRRRAGLCRWGHDFTDDRHNRACGPCHRGEPRTAQWDSLRERLRAIGVLGNKHMPDRYMRASVDQRHALLQGLIDSDGHVEKNGRGCFTNTNRHIIDGCVELLTSLGYRCHVRFEATYAAWRVHFVPTAENPVSRLAYKIERHRPASRKRLSAYRYVTDVQSVDSVPVRCVGINTDDHLFLVGRSAIATHNCANVYRALLPMIRLGPLDAVIPDSGLGRTNLSGGGLIEPVTASALSRLGQRVTFVLADEALALDTPLPTPTGWTTMGAVRVGDELIGADGRPTMVTKATKIQRDRQCYRVTFADHTSVIASDGHLWQTRMSCSAALPRVRTTGEMLADGRRFRVPPPAPYKLPEIELSVDPYLLGLWLGDGSTGACNLAKSAADVAEFQAELGRRGIETHLLKTQPDRATRMSFTSVAGYQGSLRPPQAQALSRLACWQSKHIPAEYFRASYDQRVDLLRGLMDTDGHADVKGGCVFTGTRRLCEDVVVLLRTLGQTVRMTWHLDERAREGGGGKVHFTPKGGLVPFLLTRKADRIRPRSADTWVTITSIEPVDSVPVRCVEVDADDHLFLAGEGGHVTHNTHGWTERNAGKRLADNQRRNCAGMGGRFCETTNAWSIVDNSVGQDTYENPVGVYVDYPPPIGGSVRNKAERRKAMRHAYGDSVRNGPTWRGWVDLDRIDVEIEALLKRDPGQAERFFLNRVHAGEDVAFDLEAWRNASRPEIVVPDGSLITIGVDGARWEDALAIVATEVETFHQWPLFVAERPPGADPAYEHDFEAADAAVIAAFERYSVALLYADPQKIEHLTDRWTGRYGKDHVADFVTNLRSRKLGDAVGYYVASVAGGDMTHDGDSVFARHVANARRKPLPALDEDGRSLFTLTKDRPHSPNKIDAAMAGMISAEARRDAITKGLARTGPSWFVGI